MHVEKSSKFFFADTGLLALYFISGSGPHAECICVFAKQKQDASVLNDILKFWFLMHIVLLYAFVDGPIIVGYLWI